MNIVNILICRKVANVKYPLKFIFGNNVMSVF
jgi:hypothetical protein